MIDTSISLFYQVLNGLGYHHPFHPTQVHFPVGLIFGAFVLGVAGRLRRRPPLSQAALYCMVIALIWMIPTAITGLMDWRHFYGGAMLFAFKMKFLLAAVLTVLLIAGTLIGFRRGAESGALLTIYGLCLITAAGLGFFGGELVYGGKTASTATENRQIEDYQAGQKLFAANCGGCHANGGNTINPDFPVKGSAQTKDFNSFLSWIRNPKPPMPAYPDRALSDEQAREMYRYIANVLNRS